MFQWHKDVILRDRFVCVSFKALAQWHLSGRLTPKFVLLVFVIVDEEGGTTDTRLNDLIQGAFRIQSAVNVDVTLSG